MFVLIFTRIDNAAVLRLISEWQPISVRMRISPARLSSRSLCPGMRNAHFRLPIIRRC